MAYKHIKKNQGRSFNFYQLIDVSWSQFGAPDGYSVEDGYGPDVIITFPTTAVSFVNFASLSTNAVEYSFNGTDVHGDLTPQTQTSALTFNGRNVSLIWFRVKPGCSGPATIRVEAW